jgi:hypothetical protein
MSGCAALATPTMTYALTRRDRDAPTAFDEDFADVVAALLCERHAELEIPKPSTIAAILRRRGLSSRPSRRSLGRMPRGASTSRASSEPAMVVGATR